MVDAVVAWLLAHPLQGVGVLALMAILIGVVFIPRVHEIARHGHPRC
jgi:hypothetical protein